MPTDVPLRDHRVRYRRTDKGRAKGHDDDCPKEAMRMRPVDTPPFYAAGIGAAITGTRGGVKINADMQVLDKKGRVIPVCVPGGEARGKSDVTQPGPLVLGLGGPRRPGRSRVRQAGPVLLTKCIPLRSGNDRRQR
jgi:FAD binding domain